MSLQDSVLLFVALFPFSLVIVGAAALIRKRLRKKNQARLSLVQIDPAQLKSMNNFNSRMEQLNSEAMRDEALDTDSSPVVKKARRKKRKNNRGKRK